MQYLKNTMHLELVYGAYSQSMIKPKAKTLLGQLLFRLIEYSDSNYANNSKNQKLIIKHYFFIYKAIISQCSKKQRIIFTSITKVKYIVLRYVGRKSVQIQQFFNKLKIIKSVDTYILYNDNKTSIILMQNTKN